MPLRFSGRDDADEFVVPVAMRGVGDDDDEGVVEGANRLPALFAIDYAILFMNGQGIQEHASGIFECNAMLAQVACSLVRIPAKSHPPPPRWRSQM